MKKMGNKKKVYPLLLKPVSKEIIWGGNKLRDKYGKEAPIDNIAESWELTVREKETSLIDNGKYKGMLLSEYLGEDAVNFPLLIKFIDAGDRLSVQVHPDDIGETSGKTEMWYIIEADENAELVYGLNEGVDANSFRLSVLSENTEECLHRVKVAAGDVYFIPAGQVHAIGAGILLLEIQQNSDTTYRIYDYKRIDKFGNKRELHVEKALETIRIRTESEIEELRFSKMRGENVVASCDKFTVYKYKIDKNRQFIFNDFSAVICVDGKGCIKYENNMYDISTGNSYFIPKDAGAYEIFGDLEILIAIK